MRPFPKLCVARFVDFGASSTKIYVIERGVVRASHVVNQGSQDVTLSISKSLGIPVQEAELMKQDPTIIPPEKKRDVDQMMALTLDYILAEANRVILNYQKHFNKDISRVVLVGGGSLMPNMIKMAGNHFQTEIVLGNPFEKTEAPAFLQEVLKKTGPEFAVAVGIGLRKLQEIE